MIVLLNNGALGMVRQWQTLFFHKRYSNTVLNRKTDFVKVAEAFGAKGCRVADADSFRRAFRAAMEAPGTTLIETLIGMDEMVLPMLPPGGSIEDMIVEPELEEEK